VHNIKKNLSRMKVENLGDQEMEKGQKRGRTRRHKSFTCRREAYSGIDGNPARSSSSEEGRGRKIPSQRRIE
jgi:hypothetical protein